MNTYYKADVPNDIRSLRDKIRKDAINQHVMMVCYTKLRHFKSPRLANIALSYQPFKTDLINVKDIVGFT
ncbi:MAG: hypothetical protein ACTH7M_04755, partial [Streptococcus thermophilus]